MITINNNRDVLRSRLKVMVNLLFAHLESNGYKGLSITEEAPFYIIQMEKPEKMLWQTFDSRLEKVRFISHLYHSGFESGLEEGFQNGYDSCREEWAEEKAGADW